MRCAAAQILMHQGERTWFQGVLLDGTDRRSRRGVCATRSQKDSGQNGFIRYISRSAIIKSPDLVPYSSEELHLVRMAVQGVDGIRQRLAHRRGPVLAVVQVLQLVRQQHPLQR